MKKEVYKGDDITILSDEDLKTVGRFWKCPDCGDKVFASYSFLSEAGIPFCAECDLDMDII